MITVEDKLKSFSENIIEEVQKDSEARLLEFSSKNNGLVEMERQKVIKEAEFTIEQMKKKAESDRTQIISKAVIEKDYAILVKKNQIFQRVLVDIRKMSKEFQLKPEYRSFLESCISNGLTSINTSEAIVFFTAENLHRYRDKIESFIKSHWSDKVKVNINSTELEILGGCIIENKNRTMRVDCSMAALIDDNKELIGKTLMDNLL